MYILVAVLLTIILILLVQKKIYHNQIYKLTDEIRYIKEHNTNKLVSTDISTKEIKMLQKELNQLLKEHKKLEIEIINSEKELRETITNISHDIRTPMTSLDGYFQLIRKCSPNDTEKLTRYYDIIDSRILSLRLILDQLFEFVRLQSNEYVLEMTQVNITSVLCDTVLSFYDVLVSRGIEPELKIPDTQYFVMGNQTGLVRTIQNILKNAIVHGIDHISVSLQENDKSIEIFIENNCENGDDIDKTKVFERFYMADDSRGKGSTGLGLSIARLMVLKMEGSIEAYGTNQTFGIKICIPEYK